VPGAIGQSLAATMLGALVARTCGWHWPAGVVFGVALSVASTGVPRGHGGGPVGL
jgi:CPA2 family monovalent cation:H+ antiporter-2